MTEITLHATFEQRLIGEEFKSCWEHLCEHLIGNGAWRYGSVNGRSKRLVEMEANENV